jgi:hypothetical protein
MRAQQELEIEAFSRVDFQNVFYLKQIWDDQPASHVAMHKKALDRFRASLLATASRVGGNPKGLCFVGPAGSGKTHLLGEIRREATRHATNFVMSDLTDVRDFWSQLAMHFLNSLQRQVNGVSQVHSLLLGLLRKVHDPSKAEALLKRARSRDEIVAFADDLIAKLRTACGEDVRRRQGVLRALLYLEGGDFALEERAYWFLQGDTQTDPESHDIRLNGENSAKKVSLDLAWFLSLCGPTVVAFDQLDPFVAQNNLANCGPSLSARQQEALSVVFDVVRGIWALMEESPRTLVILTCLESSWKVLSEKVIASFQDRFGGLEFLQPIRDSTTPQELIRLRLTESYQARGFKPAYPTWPFTAEYFASLPPGLTPREILTRCEEHRLHCVRSGEVVEIRSLGTSPSTDPKRTPTREIDVLFARAQAEAPVAELREDRQEDQLGALLLEAAKLLRRELPSHPDIDIAVDDDFQASKSYTSMHLRFRRIFQTDGGREEHLCIRALQRANAVAFQVRLKAALTVSGASEQLEGRRLLLVRNGNAPSGPKTAELVGRATECGAEFVPIDEADLRTIWAVVSLEAGNHPLFDTWLIHTLPLSKTRFFRNAAAAWMEREPAVSMEKLVEAVSEPVAPVVKTEPPTASRPVTSNPAAPVPLHTKPDSGILLGLRLEGGTLGPQVTVPAADLARHVIIRAGSGGGKTVYIKRLVEEAALRGIPSIVIDTAKDLALLGTRWAQNPSNWQPSDAELANRYHTIANVRIWTPGHSGGRPMKLAALPNLSGPFENEHDRGQVIDMTVAGLLPLAVRKKSATIETAILKKVVAWLTTQPANDSGSELDRLIAALRDLPGETFQGYANEHRLANNMADLLQATIVTDPLYGGTGEDVDPSVLFGVGENRTAVSILSLFAMRDIQAQARFIGQLSSVLFNWIRSHPVPAGSTMRGLLVLDEAAPFLPRGNAESKPGLLLLARQARKYGLGLVLATQNPMDLDYNATANCATHIYGTANAPQVVKFIQEAMEQRGLHGLNPAQLKQGQFFVASPALDRPVKVQMPMCLSLHPNSGQPLDEMVLDRARRGLEVNDPMEAMAV